jgi:hypothetical protein
MEIHGKRNAIGATEYARRACSCNKRRVVHHTDEKIFSLPAAGAYLLCRRQREGHASTFFEMVCAGQRRFYPAFVA